MNLRLQQFAANDQAPKFTFFSVCKQQTNKKLDDGWPESEKGDVTAAVNMMITRYQTKSFNVI